MCTSGALLKGAARKAVLLRSLSGTTHCAKHRGEYRQAAGAFAEAVALEEMKIRRACRQLSRCDSRQRYCVMRSTTITAPKPGVMRLTEYERRFPPPRRPHAT